MTDCTDIIVREATEEDVDALRDVFFAVYGGNYPYRHFFDTSWLKRSVFTDDIIMLVAADEASGEVLGTASVVLDIGAHSDLTGELGRLAVKPTARGRGIGGRLMAGRIDIIRHRLHLGLVENRCVHSWSQRISRKHGFVPVGFLPMRHLFTGGDTPGDNEYRESVSLFARHFGPGLRLRNNHPRLVPEVHTLAHLAHRHCGIECDAILDEDSPAYPPASDTYAIEELKAAGMPSLLRIERGRVRNREIFGPMRLQYGFFKLKARKASYLIARERDDDGPVAGAVGFLHDPHERTVRVFELIARSDRAVRPVLQQLLSRCAELGVEFIETDVSGHAPRMQRTLIELGFVPAAYIPAGAFHDVERLDVVRMIRLDKPLETGDLQLIPEAQQCADVVLAGLTRQQVLPKLAAAVHHLRLFDGLSDEQVTRVAGSCEVLDVTHKDQLFVAGELTNELHIVMHGEVIVRAPTGVELGTVSGGESLGEVALLTRDKHSASAEVLSETATLATISHEDLQTLVRQRPDIGVVLYRNLAQGLGRKLRRLDRRIGAKS